MTFGRVGHLFGGAGRNGGAEVQHLNPLADLHHKTHVVLDEQDRDLEFIPDVVDDLEQFLRLGGVHAGRRFVQQQQFHVGGQRPGDLQPALFAVGQVVGFEIFLALQVDHLQQALGLLGDGLFLPPELRRAQDGLGHAVVQLPQHGRLDVVDDGHLLEQPMFWKVRAMPA